MSGAPAASPRRLLYLNHVSAIGGAEASLLETIQVLPRDRFTPLAALPAPGPLADRLKALNVPVFFLPFRRFRKTLNPVSLLAAALNILGTAFRLAQIIRRERIDLVHANSATAHLVGGLAAGWTGIPCIWHCRDLVDLGALEPWLARKATAIIAISDAVSRHLQRKQPIDQVETIFNAMDAAAFEARAGGVNPRPEWGMNAGHYVVGMAGQFVPWKRHDLFLRAAARIAAAIPEARFVIAGGALFDADSTVEAGVVRLVRDLGLEGKVMLAGHRDDMAAVLKALDVLVHPAEREPLGRVILEALALGKPVVAVNAAGPAEILADGAGGVLVPPDDAAALADAVIGLRRDPPRAAALGEAGRRRVLAGFSPRAHGDRMAALYARLLPARTVAMVVGAFPSLSETFILREMQALERHGIRVIPVSLAQPAPGPVHAAAVPFLDFTCYPGRWAAIRGLAWGLVARPRRLAALAGEALRRGDPDSGSRVKALYRLGVAAEGVRLLRAVRVDRVHAHFAWVTADVGKAMARLMGVPFSLSAHAWDIYTQPAATLRSRLTGASFVAVCTQHGRARIREAAPGFPDDRLILVRHGIVPADFEPAHPESPRMLAVGRLEKKKGFWHLVEACRLMKDRDVAFDCVIVGEGPERAILEAAVAAAGLTGRVRLAGALTQEQLMEWYGTAMVVAVPSVEADGGDRDGLPNVILEAMAMGIPVVASAAGAIPEAVTDGAQGLLVAPGDAEALASALERVLADGEGRRRMGEQGRATVCRDFDAVRNATVLAEWFGAE